MNEIMLEERSMHGGHVRRAALRVVERFVLFIPVVALVWFAYVWLYGYYPDTLGWIYSELRPVTIWLYGLIDNSLPATLKYKVSAGLSDELGPRALFLLILAALAEIVWLLVWFLLSGLVRLLRWMFRSRETV